MRASGAMLLLFETAAGFALFKVLKEKKVEEAEVGAPARAQGRQQRGAGPASR